MSLDRGITPDVLSTIVEPELALHGFELVEAKVLRGGGRLTLRFAIEKPGGAKHALALFNCNDSSTVGDEGCSTDGNITVNYFSYNII